MANELAIERLNQKLGKPTDFALNNFKSYVANYPFATQVGVGICVTRYPETYKTALYAGAGLGIAATILLSFVYNTFFKRRKIVYVERIRDEVAPGSH